MSLLPKWLIGKCSTRNRKIQTLRFLVRISRFFRFSFLETANKIIKVLANI